MNNACTLYIVRHGQTDWNLQKRIQGHSDIPLNKEGLKQARLAGEKFAHIHFDSAFSSDLIRAKKTAELLLLEKKIAIQTTQILRERLYGVHEGGPVSILEELRKNLNELSHEARFKHSLGGEVESDESVVNRVITFIREIAVANPNKTILMVSHGGVMRALLIHLGYSTYDLPTKVGNTAHIKLVSDGVEFEVKEAHGITDAIIP
ncbi:MAG: histidine phosphatase family protein [Patescibacteria group bacterium]